MDQQVYTNEKFSEFFNQNFIPIRAVIEEEYGRKLRKLYDVGGFPKELIIKADGKLLDKIGSFDTPEDFFARVKESLKGTETLAGLEEAYDKNPEHILTAFKLARKYDNIYKRDCTRLCQTKKQACLEESGSAASFQWDRYRNRWIGRRK